MGGQRAEDERDGAGVGLEEADAQHAERFAGEEAGGGGGVGVGVGLGVGARTAARIGGEADIDGECPAPSAPPAAPVSPTCRAFDASGASDASSGGSSRADGTDGAPDSEEAKRPKVGSIGFLPMEPANPTDGQILGYRLAMARYQAGLSIDEVADATRIRSGMVREIEAGDFIHCGGDVYARGHVRAIAKCVGIDPEPLIAAHPPVVPMELPPRSRPRIVPRPEASPAPEESGADAATAQKSGASASRPASNAVPTSAARDKAARFAARLPSRVIRPAAEGATLTITTSGAGTAGTKGTSTAQGAGSGVVRPTQVGRRDDHGKIERHPRSANWTAAMLVALLGLVVFAGVQLLGGDGDKAAAPAAAKAPPPKPAVVQPPPAPAPPPAPKDVEVQIAAVGADSWLHVTGDDGSVIFDNLLPAGSTQSFKSAKQLGVTLGNASAVHMNLNGKDLGAAGGAGQVVHWTLSPTGAVNS